MFQLDLYEKVLLFDDLVIIDLFHWYFFKETCEYFYFYLTSL